MSKVLSGGQLLADVGGVEPAEGGAAERAVGTCSEVAVATSLWSSCGPCSGRPRAAVSQSPSEPLGWLACGMQQEQRKLIGALWCTRHVRLLWVVHESLPGSVRGVCVAWRRACARWERKGSWRAWCRSWVEGPGWMCSIPCADVLRNSTACIPACNSTYCNSCLL